VAGRIRPSQELYGRLVHNYNRQLRPVSRPELPVPVRLGAALIEVLGLDEVRSHLTLKIWLTLVRRSLFHKGPLVSQCTYTQGEMTSRHLWSRYDRHFVGITWYMCVELIGEDLPCYSNTI